MDSGLTLNVVMVGPNMSGKTVLLAVLQSRVWLPSASRIWYLDSTYNDKAYDGSLALNDIYTQIIDPNTPMPFRNQPGQFPEYGFMCRINGASDRLSPLQVQFRDIPGEDLVQPAQPGATSKSQLLAFIHEADALIGMLDGQDIHAFITGTMTSAELHRRYFGTFSNLRQSQNRQPVHLVLTKWDLFIDPKAPRQFNLGDVRRKLLEVEMFRSFVDSRHHSHIPMHLIPVSSLGVGFLDEQHRKTGKPDVTPKNIDIPLAYVLCDALALATIGTTSRSSVSTTVKTILGTAGYIIEPVIPGPVNIVFRILQVAFGERQQRVSKLRKLNEDLRRRYQIITNSEEAIAVLVSDLALQKVRFEYAEEDSVLALGVRNEG